MVELVIPGKGIGRHPAGRTIPTGGRGRLPAVSGRVAAVVEQSWHRVPGGTASATVRTLEAVARSGRYDVVGIAATHRGRPPDDLVPTVPVRHVPLPRTALYEAWHRLGRPSVQRFTGPVDVVHATGGAIPPAGDAALVVTLHDLAFIHRPGHFTTRGVAFLGRAFELARRRADLIIVPSAATAEDCAAHGVDRDRLRVVPWGVEPVPVGEADRLRVRRRHDLPPSFLLWVGTAEPRKNLRGLLAAHSRMANDIPLVLVGPGGWGTDLATLIEASPARVRHLGRVPRDELGVLYDLADVFVYPSLLEGFGMPVLEAMAQGTAVVTSAGTSTEEVVGPDGVVVDPTDVNALAAALDDLVVDEGRRGELGAAGRARAGTMSWNATGAAVADVYDEVRG